MSPIRTYLSFLMIAGCALHLFAPWALAGTCKDWVAKIVSLQGTVLVQRGGEGEWKPVQPHETFCPGDLLRVQGHSRAGLVLANEATLRVDQNTTIAFPKPVEEQISLINLFKGAVHFFSRFPRSLRVVTPFVNGAVEGTEFFVRVERDHAVFSVFEGRVAMANEAGSLALASGQSAIAEKGRSPILRVVARPRDAVHWALYYPPVFDPRRVEPPAEWQARVSRLLGVGRVEEARAEIERELKAKPDHGHALAFLAVMAVAQNEKEQGLSLARRAVKAEPRAASSHIALSYALQARFDLEGARSALREAVDREPDHALAWARLAELWMALGDLDRALEAANKAAALSPDLARTQTVLGFAYLARVETRAAIEAFGKAVRLDQADPLPRLGLGLAKIREGDLGGGRQELDIAASLDPAHALTRSYLGKAYYEETRDKDAADQLVVARELDPKDPTPFFYDAIRKQTLNRPVEALQDLEKAIELNDNRAVYRSRLLLDADLAARSASLARIYDDLGFQQLALVEGWKSVNTDSANHSAHRFLADSYFALPRHEVARVSELLQAQLLQPVNVTPVQPHLAEGNLFILSGAGPADLSYNEFNPLFNRDRLAFQLSGVAGGNSTLGNEAVVSGVSGKLSYSVGQFHYETNGFRPNNDQKQDLYNVFAQYSLSHNTSVQAEFRYKEIEKGDLPLRFNPGDFFTDLRQKEETQSARFGFRHDFSPRSIVIASVNYQKFDGTLHNIQGSTILDIDGEEEGYGAELQHLFRSERLHLVSGAGHFETDRRDVISTRIPVPPITLSSVSERETRHSNLYLYAQVRYRPEMVVTVGGSADFYRQGSVDKDLFNPKLGLTWNPLPDLTLRAAVFRVLKRTLTTKQTLEPTQVAGFNQFFDDAAGGTEAWRYGVALDRKFSRVLFGGVEYSRRDLDVPYLFVPAPPAPTVAELRQADWKERLGRAYLYWTPHTWLALSAEYLYERFDRVSEFSTGVEQVTTRRVPFGFGIFHPSGFFARLKATYFDQEGRFVPQLAIASVAGSDRFWVVDASIGYRLPRRLGIVKLEARNLLDESFKYQEMDVANPTLQPGRLVYLKITLAL